MEGMQQQALVPIFLMVCTEYEACRGRTNKEIVGLGPTHPIFILSS